MPKIGSLSQVLHAQDNTSDSEFVASKSGAKSESKCEMNENADPFSDFFITMISKHWKQQKKDQNISQIDVAKRANLFNEILNYIYVARCRRLFSLAWFDDLTYVQSEDSISKALLIACCNKPNCNSVELNYIQLEPFIDITTPKFTKIDLKLIAYYIHELKK